MAAVHGDCEQGNDCVCHPEWTGPKCDQGTCKHYKINSITVFGTYLKPYLSKVNLHVGHVVQKF